MTLAEKAQKYLRNTLVDYSDGVIKKAFIAGYKAAKEENEWRTFETVPELGRLIITKCGYWGNTTYNVAVYESNDYLDRYLRCKYEWKYID